MSALVVAAAYLLGQLGGIILGVAFEHRFKDNTFGRVGDKLGSRYHFNAVVFEGFLVYSHLVLVTRKAVQLVDNHIVPLFLVAVVYHAAKIGAVVILARHGAVYIGIDDEYIIPRRVLLAYAQLPVNGLFGLAITAVSCIDNCCFHFRLLLSSRFVFRRSETQNGNTIASKVGY